MAVFPNVQTYLPVWEMQYSLNILAYDTFLGVEAQRAANDWAGTSNLELLAALNYKNGVHTVGSNWQELNAVCNSLAGTSNLEAQFALSNLAQSEMAMALSQVATTGAAGFTLQNATPTILTWTSPNDGNLHTVLTAGILDVSSPETGGNIVTTATVNGVANAYTKWSGGLSGLQPGNPQQLVVDPNTTVTVSQSVALSGGAATAFITIFAN